MSAITPFEINVSFNLNAECGSVDSIGVQIGPRDVAKRSRQSHLWKIGAFGTVKRSGVSEGHGAWIFQASAEYSDVRALGLLPESVWLVHQFKDEIKPGDRVFLWECGRQSGIIGLAEVLEQPRTQDEPPEQIPFIRQGERFAGARLRVRLGSVKVIDPMIPRSYLRSRPDLASLTILRCPRGTNFRLSREEAEVLEELAARRTVPNSIPNPVGREKRVVFAQG